MARRLLPAVVASVTVIAFLRWMGEQQSLYGTAVGLLLMSVSTIAIIGGLLWHFAAWLDRSEAARRADERERVRASRYFELSHDMVCTAGFDGVFKQLNATWGQTLGWSEAELRSRPFVEFVHPDDRARTEHETAGLARGGVTVDFVNRYATKGGDWRWFEWRAMASLEDELIYASARDVTQREAAMELLERQRRQLSEAQSVGEFGSWVWDIAADATEWSDELYRIYGLEPSDEPISFEDFLTCVHPDDRAAVQARIHAAYGTGEPFTFEHRIVRPDGEVRIVQARGEVVIGDDGAPVRMLGTGQDITERRAVERAKDEFVSVVSHELRTPLTAIRGSLGLLAGGALAASPAKAERMLQIALQSTDRLVRLINDILDIERMQSGEVELDRRSCDAGALAQQAADTMEAAATRAGVTLHVSAGSGALWADPDRVLQTLTNLLANAIKFSGPQGHVWLGHEARDGDVIFRVRDAGRGIPSDKLESIFERFQQVDSSDARDKGGTGLGLAICRSIVEQHGGRIWAESVEGQGSTLQFTLPAALASAPVVVQPRPLILIGDGDPGVREVVGTMLAQWGYGVIAAASGQEAIRRAVSERPDAILLDLQIPGMSGLETAGALAQHPETSDVPIVMLSVLSRAQAQMSGAPAVDWIEEPFEPATLSEALDRALGARRGLSNGDAVPVGDIEHQLK